MSPVLVSVAPDWDVPMYARDTVAGTDILDWYHLFERMRQESKRSLAYRREEAWFAFLEEWDEEEYYKEDWNGEGALPLTERALVCSWTFLCALPVDIPYPDISAYPDGTVGLQWFGPTSDYAIVVQATSDWRLIYAGLFGAGNRARGIESIRLGASRRLIELIRNAVTGR